VKLKLIEPFAHRHHGLVTLDAVRAAGLSRATWLRALDNQLELVHPGVARVIGSPQTRQQQIAAAVLAAGPGAIASHRSAALNWGVDRPPTDPVDLILSDRNRQATLDGVIVHRPRDLVDLGAVIRLGIPTCKVVRWLCDLGAVDPDGVHPAVGYVVTNGLVPAHHLEAAVRVHSRCGRAGVPALRDALADWLADGKLLDSELERLMRRVAKRFRLPPMEFHAIVHGYEVDFLVVGTPIVLECDGWEFHDKRRDRFEGDRRKDAELTAAGFIVVRFTWSTLTRQPQWVASMVTNAVRRWANVDLGGLRITR
jgi:very-short-patch-repair endonuclease